MSDELPEIPCCPVHERLLKLKQLRPLDNCFVCIRNERDEIAATAERYRIMLQSIADFCHSAEAQRQAAEALAPARQPEQPEREGAPDAR